MMVMAGIEAWVPTDGRGMVMETVNDGSGFHLRLTMTWLDGDVAWFCGDSSSARGWSTMATVADVVSGRG
ncbi:hypothetical protein V6N11_029138 [Hibiscus sabdariffa]|uniref:Uncharacterized protein n=1 Tax=Hibiscus sabdariffa TaxID=183260 RepID=A0ABR2NRG7_9ROSI